MNASVPLPPSPRPAGDVPQEGRGPAGSVPSPGGPRATSPLRPFGTSAGQGGHGGERLPREAPQERSGEGASGREPDALGQATGRSAGWAEPKAGRRAQDPPGALHIIDITRVLGPSVAPYPLNPSYEREIFRDLPEATSALSRLRLGTHSGTHVDAPRHVIKHGDGIDRVPLDRLIASAVVLDLTAVSETITARDLQAQEIPLDHAVLLKTRNSAADPTVFDERFVACDESVAQYLVDRRVRAVGIDGPSIKKYKVPDRTHTILLERGIPIVESLDLSRAVPGHYTFVCLPLPLEGADGAPARAVLLTAG